MSFLSILKSRANALQGLELGEQRDLMAGVDACETACRMAVAYLQDLCAQLNVIKPAAPGLYSLDGKTPFAASAALAQCNFRCDARRKLLRSAEVCDYIGVGWNLLPACGEPVAAHSVAVNFPPDLARVAERLAVGQVVHERREQRHLESGKLLAYVFDYQGAARAFVTLTPDHDSGCIAFRPVNVGGFGVLAAVYPASQVIRPLMDELAKKLMGLPSRFA